MLSLKIWTISIISIVGSVVECSPATRAARVRFPDDARLFVNPKSIKNTWQSPKKQVLYYEYFCFLRMPPSCRQFSKQPFNSITLFRVNGSKKNFCQKDLGGVSLKNCCFSQIFEFFLTLPFKIAHFSLQKTSFLSHFSIKNFIFGNL